MEIQRNHLPTLRAIELQDRAPSRLQFTLQLAEKLDLEVDQTNLDRDLAQLSLMPQLVLVQDLLNPFIPVVHDPDQLFRNDLNDLIRRDLVPGL